jgi:hypothetical protein
MWRGRRRPPVGLSPLIIVQSSSVSDAPPMFRRALELAGRPVAALPVGAVVCRLGWG